ncbi:protein PXR1-like [Nicotiana sylvestris]|uniref:Uncharacterized protein LOC104245737 n=1 Tax=Nicotiana sylvestris TaxID=4096 RepID=A0A1U7Y6E2_NICSY|nr:PREDICTED: uncharacterized protein LOC104245737 [Nicotiana sylvestris]
MWLQKWSPDFKPEEDLPIVLVWILLPKLPFHLHTWPYVKQIAREVGTPLEMDVATRRKTRPSMAEVRVEVDLLKPLPNHIWVGNEDDDSPLKGFEQKLEYESVPKYCRHCRKLGHDLINCRVVEKMRIAEKKEEDRTMMLQEHEGGNKDSREEGLIHNNNKATQEKAKEMATMERKPPEDQKIKEMTNIKMRSNSKKKKKAKNKKITKKKPKVTFKPQKVRQKENEERNFAGDKQSIPVEENNNLQKQNEESNNSNRKEDNNNRDAQSSIKEHEVDRGKELADISSKEGRELV